MKEEPAEIQRGCRSGVDGARAPEGRRIGCDLINRTRMSVTSSKEFPEDTCPLVRCHRKRWWGTRSRPRQFEFERQTRFGLRLDRSDGRMA